MALRPISLAACLLTHAGLAAAQPDQPTLFVGHYYSLGATVATFVINSDGTLTQADNEPSGIWSQGMAISPDGATLAVGNPAGTDDGSSAQDRLYLFHVNADSTLTPIGTPAAVPASPSEMVWLDDDTLAVLRSDLGNTFINSYDVDLGTGALTLVDTVVPGGFGTSLAIDRASGLLFAQDSFGNTIFRYTFDAAGDMTPAGSVLQGSYPLDLTLSPDAGRLYTASGISANAEVITGFTVNAPGDPVPLTPLPASPYISAGDSPAYLAITGDGRHLFAGHGRDATVRGFAINADGSLTPTAAFFDVGIQGSIGDLAAYNDLLFVTDDTTASDGVSGVLVFRVDAGGGITQLGPVYPTGTPRPEADLVVWAPDAPPCLADVNGNGVVDPGDFTAWVTAYNAQAPGCDQNNDGACTPDDFTAWVVNYNTGCP
ncbi:MAG: beta-propeller fold lactonase family protein [Phycisphaerales bacterium]